MSCSNAWKYDPEVPEEFQVDLSRGSYNGRPIRGHQCMSYHRYVSYSSLLNEQTFYSTNIMPQDPDFNSGSWGDLEDLTLKYISYPDTLYNVTGTYGVQGYTTDKGGNRVAIPPVLLEGAATYQKPAGRGSGSTRLPMHRNWRQSVIGLKIPQPRPGI